MDRYPDLQAKFGDEPHSWIQAKEHFYSKGFSEGRMTKCEKGPISKCAEEGEQCQCDGMVFFTTKYNHGSQQTVPNTVNDFSQALQFAFRQENPGRNHIACNKHRFGDIAPGQAKQCFCEKEIPAKPFKCANENGGCKCPGRGRVFYGTKAVASNPEAKFLEMVDTPFAVKSAKDNGVTPCNNRFFGDPLPGISKQCYCDPDLSYPK